MLAHQKRIFGVRWQAKRDTALASQYSNQSAVVAPLCRRTPNKRPEPCSLERRWFGPEAFDVFASADKHLIVSVAAVNWAWRWRHQDFQTAPQAGQNRCQLARRLDHFSLNELSGVHHAFMGRV